MRPDATDEEVMFDAAKRAHAWTFIQDFPEGSDTLVGDTRRCSRPAASASAVAIARAHPCKHPDLLILDEASSAHSDSTSERVVQAALDELMKGRSSVVIAHRLSTVKNADRSYVLEDGRVVEEGTARGAHGPEAATTPAW